MRSHKNPHFFATRLSLSSCVGLDQSLGDDAVCRLYICDKLVEVVSTKILIPDVIFSCDAAVTLACYGCGY